MKIYCGVRDEDDFFVRVRGGAAPGQPGGEPYLLPGRPDLLRDWLPDPPAGSPPPAPPAFCWARACPGTDHLALAVAVDVAGGAGSAEEAAALLSGLPFFRRFLSHLPPDGFEIAETVFVALLKAGATKPPTASVAAWARGRSQAVGG